jgi:hypothetical protein
MITGLTEALEAGAITKQVPGVAFSRGGGGMETLGVHGLVCMDATVCEEARGGGAEMSLFHGGTGGGCNH